MLLTTLVQAATGVRYRALAAISYRTLFYPSGPPPSLNSTTLAKFPYEAREHLSEEQFRSVRDVGRGQYFSEKTFMGLLPDQKPQVMKQGLSTPAEVWEHSSTRFAETQREPPGIHKGRTVFVRQVDDLGQQYAKLNSILRNNNVRKELRLTERHEKKGAKRRRLYSERWRRKFADEVRKKVKLVTEIRLRDRMWGARH